MAVQAAPGSCNDCLTVLPVVEGVGQAAQNGPAMVEDAQDATCSGDEAGHEDDWKGCRCGHAPNLDGSMALTAWCTFGGLKHGLCGGDGDSEELLEPTNRDLKHVKECVEHLVEAHKERLEISPGRYLDQKEARGYLIARHVGLGLLPSAQLAHDIGIQLATQLAQAEKAAGKAAAAARKKAGRAGAAPGPGGPREQAAEAAADAIWTRPASLASLPNQCVASKKPARPKKPPTPTTEETDAHRPVEGLQPEDRCMLEYSDDTDDEEFKQRMAEIDRAIAADKARAAELEAQHTHDKAVRQAQLAELDREIDADTERLRAAAYCEGWNECCKEANASLEVEKGRVEWYKCGLETAEWRVRRLQRALFKAGIDPGEVDYASEFDSSECASACSE